MLSGLTTSKWHPRPGPSRRPVQLALATTLVLSSAAASAQTPPTELPTDGAVAFTYTRAPDVTGCSQSTEADVRDLVGGVIRGDAFVAPGKPAPITLRAEVTLSGPRRYRATFSLVDAAGVARGSSTVDDTRCDDLHLKLAASIALLLQPRPPAPPPVCPTCPVPVCDPTCRASVKQEVLGEARESVRADALVAMRREVELAARNKRPEVHAVIAAGGLAGFNYAADPAPGFWLAGEARAASWSVGLEARGMFPARAFTLANGAAGADLASFSGLLSPCIHWKGLGGCALLEAGGALLAGAAATGATLVAPLLGLGLRARLDIPIAAGIQARLFGDAMAHLPAAADGNDPTGPGGADTPVPFSLEAPRPVSAFVGMGIARSFE